MTKRVGGSSDGGVRGWQSWWWTCCDVAGLGGKRFGWLRVAGRHMDHPLAKICGTTAASQGVSQMHFQCWRQLARELRLHFVF